MNCLRLPIVRAMLIAAVAMRGIVVRGEAPNAPAPPAPAEPLLLNPDAAELNRQAPTSFHILLDTTKGEILLEVHREWSPRGADRFYNLVCGGYFDESKFFRIRKGEWVQFGINGDPRVSQAWREKTIPDEPRRQSNVRGTIAYAFAPGGHRSTQVFINLRDNSATHDPEPFVPFGRVVKGIETADALYADYGDAAGGGIRGGKQAPLFEQGNAYLELHFPKLDSIRRAAIVPETQR